MSKTVSKLTFVSKSLYKKASLASLLIVATSLSGCVSLDNKTVGNYAVDQFTTASTNTNAQANLNQSLPNILETSQTNRTQVAFSNQGAPKYLPPATIGNIITTQNTTFVGTQVNTGNSVISNNLPPLMPSSLPTQTPVSTPKPILESKSIMPAQTAIMQPNPAPAAGVLATVSTVKATPDNAYIHIVESGESLYSIARKYNVPVSAILSANSMGSSNIIGVGQKIGIPGRPDLVARQANVKIASVKPVVDQAIPVVATIKKPEEKKLVSVVPVVAKIATPTVVKPATPVVKPVAPVVKKAEPEIVKPTQTASAPKASIAPINEPQTFAWPISGKLIKDFAGSKNTGINISVPQGASVSSTDNGTVIYVGNAVEGYGNLILIKHKNGYVSAYAHLDKAAVKKGDKVNRGDKIGFAGQSGSVTSSQLHFELRKGATPVDPIPMLSS
jgi:murein DD-endopeptidase MepM/ murein hydrolase activator NlpD